MRLFVAIDVGEETRAQLARVRAALEPALARSRPAPKLTWVAADRAHVTIRFIGEVTEQAGHAIRDALAAPLPLRAFDVRWSGMGTFPGGRRPRVLWIGAAAGGDELATLAVAVNDRLQSLIGPPEERTFRAHLTVARVREPARVNWTRAVDAIDTGTSVSRIDHVTLYQSRLSPKGPTYTAVVTTPLNG